ncbi:MAG: PD-(D/E)XK nuclease family protein [Bacteroidetes bacterium]|jgi:RecB family exonuclease|nr:PD-(D/E)XK nuclease family protein [Bacteroidota bacterium]
MTFIEEVIHDLQNRGVAWGQTLLLFPGKRPAHYVHQHMAQTMDGPLLLPECVSISQLVENKGHLVVMDPMQLVFELYGCYLKLLDPADEPLPLLRFFPLGETIIADFNDMDAALADPKLLFSSLAQLRDLEGSFSLPPEQLEHFKRFWAHFSGKPAQGVQLDFILLWRLMGALYFSFHHRLMEMGTAYGAMAQRQLILRPGALAPYLGGKTLAICGFNALTPADEALFTLMEGLAHETLYFFDCDAHYMAPHHQAGHFMRLNRGKFPLWGGRGHDDYQLPSRLAHGHKQISVVGASGTTGMVQAMWQQMNELPHNRRNGRTGLVLPDEQSIRAVLQVVTGLPFPYNITMGLPLVSTSLWSLLADLAQLYAHFDPHKKSFAYRKVLKVLRHPDMKGFMNGESQRLQAEILSGNMVYIPLAWLDTFGLHPGLRGLLAPAHTAHELYQKLMGAAALLAKAKGEAVGEHIALHTLQQIKLFSKLYARYLNNDDVPQAWPLLKEALSGQSIAFEGEPLTGVQVMGLLEARAIDFDCLFVLSANEGVLPRAGKRQTLIPHALRKAFGLPTTGDNDAMWSYYFYRMMHRAQDVYLYYNTDTDGEGKGEMSRFVRQIKQELAHLSIKEQVYTLKGQVNNYRDWSVDKDQWAMASLARYEVKEGEVGRGMSPSALSTYIKSPIQFYLRYVANFMEPQLVMEEVDHIAMGTIVHHTLEEIYTPYLHQELGPHLMAAMQQKLVPTLGHYLEQVMHLQPAELRGRNRLFFNVCLKMAQNAITTDLHTEGLVLRALESADFYYDIPIQTTDGPKKIRLKGQLDRLDEVMGKKRLVDYKTGSVRLSVTKEDKVLPLFTKAQYAPAMQTLFYALVYLMNNPSESIQPVVFSLAKGGPGMVVPVTENAWSLPHFVAYHKGLVSLLEQIWDSQRPFELTDPESERKYLMMDLV